MKVKMKKIEVQWSILLRTKLKKLNRGLIKPPYYMIMNDIFHVLILCLVRLLLVSPFQCQLDMGWSLISLWRRLNVINSVSFSFLETWFAWVWNEPHKGFVLFFLVVNLICHLNLLSMHSKIFLDLLGHTSSIFGIGPEFKI